VGTYRERVGSLGRVAATDVPGEQFRDAVDRVVRDASQHVFQVGFRIKSVQLGRTDQAVHRGGAVATGIGPGKQIIFAAKGHGA
jgi:hypothetical protein